MELLLKMLCMAISNTKFHFIHFSYYSWLCLHLWFWTNLPKWRLKCSNMNIEMSKLRLKTKNMKNKLKCKPKDQNHQNSCNLKKKTLLTNFNQPNLLKNHQTWKIWTCPKSKLAKTLLKRRLSATKWTIMVQKHQNQLEQAKPHASTKDTNPWAASSAPDQTTESMYNYLKSKKTRRNIHILVLPKILRVMVKREKIRKFRSWLWYLRGVMIRRGLHMLANQSKGEKWKCITKEILSSSNQRKENLVVNQIPEQAILNHHNHYNDLHL